MPLRPWTISPLAVSQITAHTLCWSLPRVLVLLEMLCTGSSSPSAEQSSLLLPLLYPVLIGRPPTTRGSLSAPPLLRLPVLPQSLHCTQYKWRQAYMLSLLPSDGKPYCAHPGSSPQPPPHAACTGPWRWGLPRASPPARPSIQSCLVRVISLPKIFWWPFACLKSECYNSSVPAFG